MTAAALSLPMPLQRRLERESASMFAGDGMPQIDFSRPAGEPALAAADSVSWRVFKNPVSLFIGGVAAVLLELGEPRVRSGVWEHSSFRSDPVTRLRRTGLAAMVTVYAPASVAEAMIAGVGRQHARVRGTTREGQTYAAMDPELLDWVQATASYGFLMAYHRFVHPLDAADRDRFWREAQPGARLFGATGTADSEAGWDAMLAAKLPKLRAAPEIREFLTIMRDAPAFPRALRPMQRLLLRAAVDLLPTSAREVLELGPEAGLPRGGARLVRAAGVAADRLVIRSAPPGQACRRMGLPAEWLYRAA
ncbi:oxygenase MpaB family protein [Sphingomonas sp. ACRSK]|uniref:oxygenase MpaB family protein n=1 Tax=Sphingomonas sp. ACRSK TaxID=2918213 RepID=UPI001EF6A405|nr:oxygenase MpaB family protein [Sphingomonas sp. ACRSK]MCG7349871.1 oxygenase MpaB family protein [Sphingomonas sp. ACRSK]